MEKIIIIDAQGCSYGRVCSFAAKTALQGNQVRVLNCEKSLVTGNAADILGKFQHLRTLGGRSLKGGRVPKDIEKFMKRTIKKMLPDFRYGQGKLAAARIKCHKGVPAEFEKEKMVKLPECKSNKVLLLNDLVKRL